MWCDWSDSELERFYGPGALEKQQATDRRQAIAFFVAILLFLLWAGFSCKDAGC
jgi:hypothetical protein